MQKINTNTKGKLITDPLEIIKLANNKKAVVFHGTRLPAAIVQNWQLRFLINQINGKYLYEYKPKKERVINAE